MGPTKVRKLILRLQLSIYTPELQRILATPWPSCNLACERSLCCFKPYLVDPPVLEEKEIVLFSPPPTQYFGFSLNDHLGLLFLVPFILLGEQCEYQIILKILYYIIENSDRYIFMMSNNSIHPSVFINIMNP